VEILVADIKAKNDEITDQEAHFSADIDSLKHKLKAERARCKALEDRLNLEVSRHLDTRSRLDSFEESGIFQNPEDALKLLGSLKDSELNLTSLHDRVQELQQLLVDKTTQVESLEAQVASYRDKTERLRTSEQALYAEVSKTSQRALDLTRAKEELELTRLELHNLTQVSASQRQLIAQLEEERGHLQGELSELRTEVDEKDQRLQGVELENGEVMGKLRELQDKLTALARKEHMTLLEGDAASCMRVSRDWGRVDGRKSLVLQETEDTTWRVKTDLERELSQARRLLDASAAELRTIKEEVTWLETDNKRAESALADAVRSFELKSRHQEDALKQARLEVARLQSMEDWGSSQGLKQEVESLRKEKLRLRRKLESLEDSRRDDSSLQSRQQEDYTLQIEGLRRALSSKEQDLLTLRASLDVAKRQLEEQELMISQLKAQVSVPKSSKLESGQTEASMMNFRGTTQMSATAAETPANYRTMWQKEKDRVADLTEDLHRIKDSSDEHRDLLESLLGYIEQTSSSWTSVDIDMEVRARVLRAKETIAEKSGLVKTQLRSVKQPPSSSIERRSEECLRRLEEAAEEVDAQLKTTETVQHSTVLALIGDKIAAEKELYTKSRTVLDIELNFPDEGLHKWALQKWQEAEQEVVRLRSQLLDSAKKMEHLWRKYDPGNEVLELRQLLDKSTAQLKSLQKAVNFLQDQRHKGPEPANTGLEPIKTAQESSKTSLEPLKTGETVMRSHLKVLMDEVEILRAQVTAKDTEITALHQAGLLRQQPGQRLKRPETRAEETGLEQLTQELQQKTGLVERLRHELEQCKAFYTSREDEYRELLTYKDHELKRLLSSAAREDSSKSRRDQGDEFVLELLGRRNSALKEIQEYERSNRVVDPVMKAYVKELNTAIARYGDPRSAGIKP
jgi:DNA repair exonuclease SbcCD ATPase subunit